MSCKFQDFNEIKTSKENIQYRPHLINSILIYIVFTLITVIFIWMWFSEKDIVVKVDGVVKTDKEVSVSNKVMGTVEQVYFRNGDIVTKDQILYIIEHKNLDVELERVKEELSIAEQELSYLDKLKKSILDGKNYFNKELQGEELYHDKYLKYINEYSEIKNNRTLNELEKYKLNALLDIEEKVTDIKHNIRIYEMDVKDISNSIEECHIKAKADGVINITSDIIVGDVLQPSIKVATIVPQNIQDFKVQLYISTEDIGKLRNGQDVKLDFGQSYNAKCNKKVYGKLNNISIDSKISDKDSIPFYTAEVSVKNNDEISNIKLGMSCQGNVIVGRKKVLIYLFEQLGIN